MKIGEILKKIEEINILKNRIKENEQMQRMFGPSERGNQHLNNLKAELKALEEEEV